MGKLIVIEGLDGSGKATQTARLYEAACAAGRVCRRITFPDYESASSGPVKMYLSGALGTLEEVNPYGASLLYAADRFASYRSDWRRDYEAGSLIIADRYATSNISYQMSRLPRREWDGYIAWMEELEYGRVGIPKPDAVVYLDMQPETSRRLLEKRYGGDTSRLDLHERDLQFLQQCRTAALYGAQKQGWRLLQCCDGRQPLPPDTIAAMIQQTVKEFLC